MQELVWYDVQSLESQIATLFGLTMRPIRGSAWTSAAGDQTVLLSLADLSMRTQALVMTMFRTVEHVSRLIDAVGALIGNMVGIRSTSKPTLR